MERISTHISTDGFEGILYPVTNRKDKVVIVVSGSNGGLTMTRQCAEFYAESGIPSLALALFKTKETPKDLSCIPIEYVELAIKYLKNMGYKNIGIDGMSKGSELALLSATMFKDLTCVIARVPSHFVSEGLISKKPSGTSCWSYQEKEIPFARYKSRDFNIPKMLIKEREWNLLDINRDKNVTSESIIPVEKINGAVLLLSSINDTVWSSFQSSQYIENRLKEKDFAFPHKHIAFPNMSHIMLTDISDTMKILFKSERKNKVQCKSEREELKKELLNWVEKVWNNQIEKDAQVMDKEDKMEHSKNEIGIPSRVKILKREIDTNNNSLER